MSWYAALARALVTIALLASWNITTTHCAFAAAVNPATPAAGHPDADECPMHAAKKSPPPPQRKKGCADLPCCKTLPATIAAKALTAAKSPESFRAPHFTPADVCQPHNYKLTT